MGRALCAAGVALLLSGCSYGPPRLEIRLTNHVRAADRPVAAFAVYAAWVQPPRGLATFPDGGRPRILSESAAVYACDTLTLELHRLWRVDRPPSIHSGFGPWLGPWSAEGLYVSLRGYAREESDPNAAIRLNYRIDGSGSVTEGAVEPPLGAATSEPGRCAESVLNAARNDPPARIP